MYRNRSNVLALAAAAVLAIQGCREQAAPTEVPAQPGLSASATSPVQAGRYLVVFAVERVSDDFGTRVSQLAGAVETSLDSIGAATVTGLSEAAAAELATGADIEAVEADRVIALVDDAEAPEASAAFTAGQTLAPADVTASPTGAQFYARQWNMRAVFADQAWAAGHLGSRDVVVAILDTGIDYTLPDFAGLVDVGRSKSFTPEEDPVVTERYPGRLPISDLRDHGTAAASVIATNGMVLAGVNQEATLIAVKIFDRFDQGSVAQFLQGLVYAADQGADVINMSLRFSLHKRAGRGIVAAINRAANYAFRHGAVLVASAGNDTTSLDHNGDLVALPCEAPHVICAAATAPTAAASVSGPWENVDAPASYTAFGRSAIDVAAPGGDGLPNQFRRVWLRCTTTPTEESAPPCRRGMPITQGFGTSWAAPHVAGLAALLVAQLGHGNPALIRARILQSADDLGQRGTDAYYGKGRINIARALGVLP